MTRKVVNRTVPLTSKKKAKSGSSLKIEGSPRAQNLKSRVSSIKDCCKSYDFLDAEGQQLIARGH